MNNPRLLLLAPAVALTSFFVLVPALLLLRVSLYEPARGRGFYTASTATLENFAQLGNADTAGMFGFTLLFAACIAACSIGIGFPLALWIRSLTARCQWFALVLVLLPKTAGLLAMLFGLQRLLPRGFVGALIAETSLILPYAVLVLVVQLRAINPVWIAAARGLGASRWQVFRRIVVPLALPGLVLAGELGFIWGLGAFLGPAFLGGPEEMTIAGDIHRQAFEYNRWPRAAAEAIALLLLVGLILLVAARWRGRTR